MFATCSATVRRSTCVLNHIVIKLLVRFTGKRPQPSTVQAIQTAEACLSQVMKHVPQKVCLFSVIVLRFVVCVQGLWLSVVAFVAGFRATSCDLSELYGSSVRALSGRQPSCKPRSCTSISSASMARGPRDLADCASASTARCLSRHQRLGHPNVHDM